MLLNLHVKNMMLIENVDISFTDHLNILTGETGAGKSIIIGSIALALGGRANKDLIRKGADCGQVELLFSVERESTRAMLKALEIETEDGELLISRTLYENRVVNKMNDQTVTAAKLKAAAEVLLDLHAQHEQQALTKKGYQMDIVDRYGEEDIGELKVLVSEAYEAYRRAKAALEQNSMSGTERKRTMDLLRYELDEIAAANLSAGEDERLMKRYQKMKNGRELLTHVNQVHEITGYEADGSAGSLIGRASAWMEQASALDDDLLGLYSQIMDIEALISDFNRELSDYGDKMQFDAQQFSETEQRLDVINGLKVKYGNTIEDILSYAGKKQEELDKLSDYEGYLKSLEKRLHEAAHSYQELADRLHERRVFYAKKLSGEILASLQDLNFMNVDFEIAVNASETYSALGMDEVIFMISTNAGEKRRPMSDVASGGELSRIMLAVKAVLADTDAIDTLIFDEIDVGISGRTAQRVSEKLHRIARQHQVISITHLPQIAAMADAHYCIEKRVTGDKTVTDIVRLSESETVDELARLIGGVEITKTVLSSAREMKAMAKKVKEEQ